MHSHQDRHPLGNGNAVYIVEERANPSTDYFILPAVSVTGQRVVRCRFDELPSPAELTGATVVFVRYVSPAWAKLLEKERPRLRAMVFFMDDDVLDTRATAGMPWRYRLKLARMAAWRQRWLKRQGAELWVATDYLQKKYAEWRPRLVMPVPALHPADVCRVFYHGSDSHRAEIQWLRPVIAAVMRHDDRITFEIIGGADVYRLYRGIPRVTVVHPMRWPSYQSFLSMPGRHIGLAPLLDLPFNRARSCTKFFDITRCGAVGVYASNSSYAEVIDHGTDGLIAGRERGAWIEAIVKLAGDEELRQTLLRNAEAKMQVLTERAQQNHRGLLGGGAGGPACPGSDGPSWRP